ncbi:motility associated factor glycosyltransferase family protein [Paenibacillus protaetiae]|uniref:DUF115 domain-containing protein n=1 Tax=Paenibacillus protaetiae TaxID=2509456 RepID=A0A4P6EZM3_9BACL|nr:6-hydroxymethylpterin diphosphokinase MptE-like protein [Paenibacillus protaetiae]QAY67763.1 DUF115 domain-containing protein [Paenibacillus protaetiae]
MENKRLQEETLQIMEAIRPFLPNLVEACTALSDLLHDAMTEQSWQRLGEVVEGIDDLYKTLSSVGEQAVQYGLLRQASFDRTMSEIEGYFGILNQRMDQEDYIGAGDCLLYELVPVFQRIARELGDSEAVKEQRYAANMKALAQRFPALYAAVREAAAGNAVQTEYSENWIPVFALREEGRQLSGYSRLNPLRETERWASSFQAVHAAAVKMALYGFGFGYHALSYAGRFPDHDLYIYEPRMDVLAAALRAVDLTGLILSPRLKAFSAGSGCANLEELIKLFAESDGEPRTAVVPLYERLDRQGAQWFVEQAQMKALHHINFIYNYKRFGMEWTRNSLYNVKPVLDTPPIAGLQNQFQGITAVVVGAGPSLEADIECLRRLREHAMIIAAGSTIQSLLHHGIQPHAVISIDGTEYNYKAFERLDLNGIPLFFAPMIEHRIIESKPSGLYHFFIKGDSAIEYLMDVQNNPDYFQSTYSVSGTAIQVAAFMGAAEIVLAGQDLSYPSNAIYAAGAEHVSAEVAMGLIAEADRTVPNVKGGVNRIDARLQATLYNMEELIGTFPDIRFVNTSSLGARIRHCEWMPMEAVLAKLQEQGVVFDENEWGRKLAGLEHYDRERIKQITGKIAGLLGQMADTRTDLALLIQTIGLLEQTEKSRLDQCNEYMDRIDEIWERVTAGDPFQTLYLRACRSSIKQYEVSLPELKHAATIPDQARFYSERMKPLVHEMMDSWGPLSDIVLEICRRLEA